MREGTRRWLLAGSLLVAIAVAGSAKAMTLTFEKLGTFVPNIQALSYRVTDSNPDLAAWDCSSGTCVATNSDVCPAGATICEVQGFRTAETVIITASSADCYACPPSHPQPGESCGTVSSSCPDQSGASGANCPEGVRFATFTVGGKGEFVLGGQGCQMTYTVTGDATIGGCWQCGPSYAGAVPGQYIGTSCDCQTLAPPALPGAGATTTTTVPGQSGTAVQQAIDQLIDSFLPISVQDVLRRLPFEGRGLDPENKSQLRGTATTPAGAPTRSLVATSATSGTVVVFRGRKHVRKAGPVTLRLKLTPAGRHLLRHSSGSSIPLTLTLTLSGHGTTASASRTVTLIP
jgi:hypothetical protein